MKQTNPKISAKTVNRKDVLGAEFSIENEEKKEAAEKASASERKIQAIAKQSRALQTVPEQIAQDKLCYRNHIWPGAKNSFPFHPKLQTVDKYFPYADGGPLFVDELQHTDDKTKFDSKKEAMKTLGHRYLVMTPGMTFHEALEELA